MQMHLLTRTQTLSLPPPDVFPFFRSPENLARITPPWLGFRILTPLPVDVRAGTILDYTVRWSGMRVRWRTMITTYEPPRLFVDEQIKGPFSFWHHTHLFEESGSGTNMTDTVRYIMPLGSLGDLLHPLLVGRQLREIFDYRFSVIPREVGGLAGGSLIEQEQSR